MNPLSKRAATCLSCVMATWLAVVLLAGCITRTVAPKPIQDSTASFSETGNADSGIIGFQTNAVGVASLIVTPSYRARFNAMVPKYGGLFLPRVQEDQGFTRYGSNWLVTLDSAAKMIRMNRARKADP